jgi:hypothetical protein
LSPNTRLTHHPLLFSPPLFSPSLFLQKVGAKGKKGGKKNLVKYTIDCNQPVDDKVLDMATFEKFLKDRIKVRSSLPPSLPPSLPRSLELPLFAPDTRRTLQLCVGKQIIQIND